MGFAMHITGFYHLWDLQRREWSLPLKTPFSEPCFEHMQHAFTPDQMQEALRSPAPIPKSIQNCPFSSALGNPLHYCLDAFEQKILPPLMEINWVQSGEGLPREQDPSTPILSQTATTVLDIACRRILNTPLNHLLTNVAGPQVA